MYLLVIDNNDLNSIGKNIDTIGSLNASGNIGETYSSNLSNSIKNYKFIILLFFADGYKDTRFLTIRNIETGSLNGRGYYMKIYASNNYWSEVNVGFYNDYTFEVRTLNYSGWAGSVWVYGLN